MEGSREGPVQARIAIDHQHVLALHTEVIGDLQTNFVEAHQHHVVHKIRALVYIDTWAQIHTRLCMYTHAHKHTLCIYTHCSAYPRVHLVLGHRILRVRRHSWRVRTSHGLGGSVGRENSSGQGVVQSVEVFVDNISHEKAPERGKEKAHELVVVQDAGVPRQNLCVDRCGSEESI